MNNNLLKDIVKTRAVLKEKLKYMKLNDMDRVKILEDTFQPITKPLNQIIGKLDNKSNNKQISTINKDTDDMFSDNSNENQNENMNDINNSLSDYYENNDNSIENMSVSTTAYPEYKTFLKRSSTPDNRITKRIKELNTVSNIFNEAKNSFHNIKENEGSSKPDYNNLNLTPKITFPNTHDNDITNKSELKRKDFMDLNNDKKRVKLSTLKRKCESFLDSEPKRIKIEKNLKRKNTFPLSDYEEYKKRNKKTHLFSKRKSTLQLNNDKKRIKFSTCNYDNNNSNKSVLFQNIQLLMNNKNLDTIYGFNINAKGKWQYGRSRLEFNNDNSIQIGNTKWKMTPGLFELLFHIKPSHYNKKDLQKYKEILTTTNAHRRNYQTNEQVKGTKAFKYQRVIKKLFNSNTNVLTKGSGLLLKSVDLKKPNYIYWDNSNELVDRLRLLLSSESVGHNNHKNEIVSIVEELKEANIIY